MVHLDCDHGILHHLRGPSFPQAGIGFVVGPLLGSIWQDPKLSYLTATAMSACQIAAVSSAFVETHPALTKPPITDTSPPNMPMQQPAAAVPALTATSEDTTSALSLLKQLPLFSFMNLFTRDRTLASLVAVSALQVIVGCNSIGGGVAI